MNIYQARERVNQVIAAGAALNPSDSEQFTRWVESSYEALEPLSHSQQQFDKYCRTSCDTAEMRAYIGLCLLRLAAARLER
jgi:hypothetical protein